MIIGSKEKNDQERPGNKGGSSACAPSARPLFEMFLVFNFENFDCRTRIDFIVINMQCSQWVFVSTLTTKGKGKCKGASKLFPDLKNYIALGPRPPDLKSLDPPLERG